MPHRNISWIIVVKNYSCVRRARHFTKGQKKNYKIVNWKFDLVIRLEKNLSTSLSQHQVMKQMSCWFYGP